MLENPPGPAEYSRAAIGTRSYHTEVSLAPIAEEEGDTNSQIPERKMHKVHSARRAEGTVLSHFALPVARREWRPQLVPPAARIDKPLWSPPAPLGMVTVDLSEDSKRILPFDDPVWERAGKACVEAVTMPGDNSSDSENDDGGGRDRAPKKLTIEVRKFHWIQQGWTGDRQEMP
eukprot:1787412-Rhodomonas_salina.4